MNLITFLNILHLCVIITADTEDDLSTHPNWKLINEEDCGVSLTDRINDGDTAKLGQYPWIAHLGYIIPAKMPMPPMFKCAGTLINNRYVLSTAQCVTNLPEGRVLTVIRLGEYDTESAEYCDDSGLCTAPAQNFKPEKCIWHENFDNLIYDIALIRLDRIVTFSTWIAPICLPQGRLLKQNFLKQRVEEIGWGWLRKGENSGSTILQMIKWPIVQIKDCEAVFGASTLDTTKQLCVGGNVEKNLCRGESGGPLMKVLKMAGVPKYVLIGCVSFGGKLCDDANEPGVAIRVTYYIRWILDHLGSSYDFATHPHWKLINEEDCGLSLSYRIIGGKTATLGQYPWIANLGNTIPAKMPMLPEFYCAGSLINNRYVLTAAQCVTLSDGRELTLIRLGQLNTEIDEQCDESELCAAPSQDFKPEQIIVHANWSSDFIHDIALIRLDKTVTYSTWITPICLPQKDLFRHPIVGQTYTVAGWGVSQADDKTRSHIIRTVNVPVVPFKYCELIFGATTVNGTKQVCAGGKEGEGTCFGDAGDPLMKVTEMDNGPRYVLIGTASFGPTTCALKDGPAVFTRVPYYMPWVLDHIRPAYNFTTHPNWRLINEEECGELLTDKIIGGTVASLGQFPWIAILGYIFPSKMPMLPDFRCGGSLINTRYVLTAAHCVTGLPSYMELSIIRLGEYITVTEDNCDESEQCADPAQDYKAEKIIWHEDYNGKYNLTNNIALIRLDQTVVYSRWISPICLPQGDLLKKSFLKQTAEVAGWGYYQMGIKSNSPILRTVKLPVIPFKNCLLEYGPLFMDNTQQMCVGGVAGKDPCLGDAGGPLMKVEQIHNVPKYVMIGCISFFANTCEIAVADKPGVSTRVSYYMGWILDHLVYDIASHPNLYLINEEECGAPFTDRIIGGSLARLGQYPWMAQLGYIHQSEMSMLPIFDCAGSLINSRYVLSAAHCVTTLPKETELSVIRLGEYITETEEDCDDSRCSAPVQDFTPEKIIWHEDWANYTNDIALIRLNETVTYSTWISPICLPMGKPLKESFLGQTVEVAGWGRYEMHLKNYSTILRRGKLSIVQFKKCQVVFPALPLESAKILCVGGGKTGTCKGDAGSPLMKVTKMHKGPKVIMIGCISFAKKKCGVANLPSLSTRMSYYMPWVLDNIDD